MFASSFLWLDFPQITDLYAMATGECMPDTLAKFSGYTNHLFKLLLTLQVLTHFPVRDGRKQSRKEEIREALGDSHKVISSIILLDVF